MHGENVSAGHFHKKQYTPESEKMAKMKTVKRFMAVFAAMIIITTSGSAAQEQLLIAAGVPIGVDVHTSGVLVTGLSPIGDEGKSPAQAAGIRRGDIIESVNGEKTETAEELCGAVGESAGSALLVEYLRGGKPMSATVYPIRDFEGKYKIGLLVRDGASGIGTLTYIDPLTNGFAALGHGICDTESGVLLPIIKGTAEEVVLSGITRGRAGSPGELHGFFSGRRTGTIKSNAVSGVGGELFSIPSGLENELYPIGRREDVREGKAYIFTTVDETGRQKYEVEISKIDIGGAQKNFTVKVTDERLIEKTGGIVQGMSGSPIIQDGKLVGAVTHVLISDSTSGYGIFIENMINSPAGTVFCEIAA